MDKSEKPNGMFFSDMDEDDLTKYIHEEEKGWGSFYKRIFNK